MAGAAARSASTTALRPATTSGPSVLTLRARDDPPEPRPAGTPRPPRGTGPRDVARLASGIASPDPERLPRPVPLLPGASLPWTCSPRRPADRFLAAAVRLAARMA